MVANMSDICREIIERCYREKLKVMIFEDNKKISEIISDSISGPFMNIVGATDINEFRKIILPDIRSWACWIMDLSVNEELQGIQILEEYAKKYPYIIIYSGLKSMELAAETIALGAITVFDKNAKK